MLVTSLCFPSIFFAPTVSNAAFALNCTLSCFCSILGWNLPWNDWSNHIHGTSIISISIITLEIQWRPPKVGHLIFFPIIWLCGILDSSLDHLSEISFHPLVRTLFSYVPAKNRTDIFYKLWTLFINVIKGMTFMRFTESRTIFIAWQNDHVACQYWPIWFLNHSILVIRGQSTSLGGHLLIK